MISDVAVCSRLNGEENMQYLANINSYPVSDAELKEAVEDCKSWNFKQFVLTCNQIAIEIEQLRLSFGSYYNEDLRLSMIKQAEELQHNIDVYVKAFEIAHNIK